jgi:hypothetical protein
MQTQKEKQSPEENTQQGRRMAIIGQCLRCVIRESNPAPCSAAYAKGLNATLVCSLQDVCLNQDANLFQLHGRVFGIVLFMLSVEPVITGTAACFTFHVRFPSLQSALTFLLIYLAIVYQIVPLLSRIAGRCVIRFYLRGCTVQWLHFHGPI